MKVSIPLRIISTLNTREHWGVKARRAARERQAGCFITPATVKPPVVVTLTRIGRRRMDDDNVQGALKSFRDGIADKLGIDDGSDQVEWKYEQKLGKSYAVEIEFLAASGKR